MQGLQQNELIFVVWTWRTFHWYLILESDDLHSIHSIFSTKKKKNSNITESQSGATDVHTKNLTLLPEANRRSLNGHLICWTLGLFRKRGLLPALIQIKPQELKRQLQSRQSLIRHVQSPFCSGMPQVCRCTSASRYYRVFSYFSPGARQPGSAGVRCNSHTGLFFYLLLLNRNWSWRELTTSDREHLLNFLFSIRRTDSCWIYRSQLAAFMLRRLVPCW